MNKNHNRLKLSLLLVLCPALLGAASPTKQSSSSVGIKNVSATPSSDKVGIKNVSAMPATDLKIGVVDSFAVMRDSEEGQKAAKKLEQERDILTAKIRKKEEEYTTKANELKAKSSIMSDDLRAEREEDLRNIQRDLNRLMEESEYAIKLKMQQETTKLSNLVSNKATELALQKGYTIIIDAQSGRPIYIDEEFDITKDLVSLMNEKVPAPSKSGSSAPMKMAANSPTPATTSSKK